MGSSIGKKIGLVFFIVLAINFSAVYFLTKPTELQAAKLVDFSQTSHQENKTIDTKYKSVASEIQEYMKRQKFSTKKHIVISDEIKQPVIIDHPEVIPVKSKENKVLPKLAIIMDDIGFYRHADNIKRIPFPITPSIFPPNSNFPNTPKIAKQFKHYMVHLPMEAYNYKNISEKAVNVSDSYEVLDSRVNSLKDDFPNLIAINNHTGSKFTCNYNAMEQFFSILEKYNFEFIDSKTANKSKCVEAAKVYDKKILVRDVFLDNVVEVSKIQDRLKQAVRIAKKNGQAIAICHPKSETFKALMSSQHILKDVELVYVNELL